MDPTQLVNEIWEAEEKSNLFFTNRVRKFAEFVGDDDIAANATFAGIEPDTAREQAVEIIADLAESIGFNFQQVWHGRN